MVTIVLASPATAADPTNAFARDRNVPVAERVLPDIPVRHLGSFIIDPEMKAGIALVDNLFYTRGGKVSAAAVQLDPSFDIRSDWSRHAVHALVQVDADEFASHTSENTVGETLLADGRYDIGRATNLSGGVGFTHGYDPRYATTSPLKAKHPVRVDSQTAKLQFATEGSRLRFVAGSTYADLNYFDATDRDTGAVIDQDYRDAKQWLGETRLEYALLPDTSVYVVYQGVRSDYKVKTDPVAGTVDHSSSGYNYALGASFDLTALVTGEVEYGYLRRTYKYAAFKPISGPSYKVKLSYFPTRLETITFNASRSVEETPAIDVSGYIRTAESLAIDHEWSRLLILSASFSAETDRYNSDTRRDRFRSLFIGARYSASRNVSIVGGYTYRSLSSQGSAVPAGFGYTANQVSVSLAYKF